MRAVPFRAAEGRSEQTRAVSFRRAAVRLWATVAEWRRRHRSRAQLARLDDRMLRDIGITRLDAEFELGKPFWRP